jgi:hypothetical protein
MCDLWERLERADQQQKSGQAKPRSQAKPREWAECKMATPRGRKAGQSHEWDRDEPIRMVLQRLAAPVWMSVIQQIRNIACKIE